MKLFASQQFLRFLVTGGCAAAVNFLSRIAFSQFVSFSAAVTMAYGMGMVTAFVLARTFVFKDSVHSTAHSAFYFFMVNMVALAQTWLVSTGLAFHVFPALGMHWHPTELAHLAGILTPAFTSYWGHKKLTFQQRAEA